MTVSDMIEIPGRRVGILGGTFDPVHNGHLSMAKQVLDLFRLDSLLFIPSARPPHKDHIKTIPFFDRLEMLELATRNDKHFVVSDLESRREGPSYSIDTLIDLKSMLPDDVLLFFIIGMDAFVELNTWKRYRELTDHSNLLVIDRPNYPLTMIDGVVKQLGEYSFDHVHDCWTAPEHRGRIYPLKVQPVDISSTEIRLRKKQDLDISEFVPAPVLEYITKNRLYL